MIFRKHICIINLFSSTAYTETSEYENLITYIKYENLITHTDPQIWYVHRVLFYITNYTLSRFQNLQVASLGSLNDGTKIIKARSVKQIRTIIPNIITSAIWQLLMHYYLHGTQRSEMDILTMYPEIFSGTCVGTELL